MSLAKPDVLIVVVVSVDESPGAASMEKY